MKKISLLLLIVTLLTSCDEDTVELQPDDCTACQEAIDHMADKLKVNNCNPAYMQPAWDQIKEDCGVMADTYVGFMAETCDFTGLVTPKCGLFSSISIKDIFFGYITSTRSLPEPVEVTVHYANDFSKIEIYEYSYLEETGSDNFVYDTTNHNFATAGSYDISRIYPHILMEGAVITVTLYKAGTDDELASAENIFSFERSELDWHKRRDILINFTEDSEYTIGFTDWEDWD